jgi:hypothetical protein
MSLLANVDCTISITFSKTEKIEVTSFYSFFLFFEIRRKQNSSKFLPIFHLISLILLLLPISIPFGFCGFADFSEENGKKKKRKNSDFSKLPIVQFVPSEIKKKENEKSFFFQNGKNLKCVKFTWKDFLNFIKHNLQN